MECGSYNTSKEGEEGIPMVQRPETDVPQPDEGDGWETEREEEVLEGEEASETNEDQSNIQELVDIVEGLNISEVVLNIDGENNDVAPLDWEGKLCDLINALFPLLYQRNVW